MRIRNQAKLAGIPIFNASSGSHSPAPSIGLKCQLSQSPWHCLDSPLSSYQIGGEGDYTLDMSFWNSVEPINSFHPMEISPAFSNKSVKKAAFSDNQEGLKLCAKTDGKSWKCKAEVAEGQTMCQHHLDQLKSYNNNNNNTIIYGNSVVNNVRRKKRVSPSSDPYYYYSGFGRHTRKLRSARADHDDRPDDRSVIMEDDRPDDRLVVMEDEHRDKLDYIDNSNSDEGDDDDDVVRRVRKPVKERSLKSLM